MVLCRCAELARLRLLLEAPPLAIPGEFDLTVLRLVLTDRVDLVDLVLRVLARLRTLMLLFVDELTEDRSDGDGDGRRVRLLPRDCLDASRTFILSRVILALSDFTSAFDLDSSFANRDFVRL